MATTPFSLTIFVADGDPDRLRLIERSNWNGKGVMFPRALYTEVRKRHEFEQAGVYLLIGPAEQGDRDKIYIGEGDPVKPRLEEGYAKRDFWNRAVFFVGGPGQLNKAHVQYLEARLVHLAKEAKRVDLENIKNPDDPTLSEAGKAEMDVFLSNILGMFPVLGIHAFEGSGRGVSSNTGGTLTCRGRGANATGVDTPAGFVVRKGSIVAAKETASFPKYFANAAKLRKELQKVGVLKATKNHLAFAQDYTFTSPSYASSVVLGHNSNGRDSWKDSNGKTLKQIQESQATVTD